MALNKDESDRLTRAEERLNALAARVKALEVAIYSMFGAILLSFLGALVALVMKTGDGMSP